MIWTVGIVKRLEVGVLQRHLSQVSSTNDLRLEFLTDAQTPSPSSSLFSFADSAAALAGVVKVISSGLLGDPMSMSDMSAAIDSRAFVDCE